MPRLRAAGVSARMPAMQNKSDSKPVIAPNGGYRKTISFGLTCLVYHATTRFCGRVYSYRNDPLGKTVGQMVGAGRSARQNIAEASARAGTSKETELRLLDVARGSLEELAGDYEAFLCDRDEPVWSKHDPRCKEVNALAYDLFDAEEDAAHRFSLHIIAMRRRFAPWLEHEDALAAANAIFAIARRAGLLLGKQMERIAADIVENGGFRENLTRRRLEHREGAGGGNEAAPECPDCGKPMRRRTAKTGARAGKDFWSCSAYPDCKGTRNID